MAPARTDALLDDAVFGSASQGSDITVAATITNVHGQKFQLANVHLHASGNLHDLGDTAMAPIVDNYADVRRVDMTIDNLPKNGHTHGTLRDGDGRVYTILSLDVRGSRLRLYLSSELV